MLITTFVVAFKKLYIVKKNILMVLLKYISTPELDFSQSFKNGLIKINRLNFFEKYMLFFWLAGPFIFLIERSPADIWLRDNTIPKLKVHLRVPHDVSFCHRKEID